MKIPFIRLNDQYQELKMEIDGQIKDVLDSGIYVSNRKNESLEKEFSSFCGKKFGLTCNGGTAALHLALLSCGIKPGDEIITTANTFIATTEAIAHAGAKPVFVEIKDDFTIDPDKIEEKITSKTKMILPVHLYGQPADMDKIISIASRHNLLILEDCSQAHGATYNGKRVPITRGAFSFYPTKNLGTIGEGGIVLTDEQAELDLLKSYRIHGMKEKHNHVYIGYNYKMGEIEAAVLSEKLKKLDEWNERRRSIAKRYSTEIKNPLVQVPVEDNRSKHVYHVYCLRVKDRTHFQTYLHGLGIDTQIHYPTPIHLQGAFSYLGYKKEDLPITEQIVSEIVSLPIYPHMNKEEVDYVIEKINAYSK
ncbi:MAG: DegT/DnrJ/EryC1/StrS family aminotransferase [Candidatus Nanoarchaeia archaeon]